MRHRDDRDVDARERAELLREHAARVDDDLGLDLAAVGDDAGDAAAARRDRGHARAGADLGAAAARALGERERELARVDVAVGGEVGRAEHALGRHRREQPLRLLGRDELERQPERLRPARLARELLHALLRRGEAQRADLLPARLQADLVGERAVEVDRVHHHPRQRQRAAQLPDEPGRVEGRAGRQVGPLDEHDVVPAEPRQPVEDRAAAHAAADDDGARTVRHRSARRKRSESAVSSIRSKCSAAYASKSNSMLGDRLLHDAPHRLAEVGHEPHLHERALLLDPVGGEQERVVLVSSRPWLTEKFARSKKRSPMPAYSQSTIQMRPFSSAMKFAFSRSLWQKTVGCGGRRRSIMSAIGFARSYAFGTVMPCAVAVAAVRLDDAEGVEAGRDRAAVVEAPQGPHHVEDHLAVAHPLGADRRAARCSA